MVTNSTEYSREYSRAYYKANREKILEQRRKKYAEEPYRERKNAESRRWYAAHAEETREIRRAYGRKHCQTTKHGLVVGEWLAIFAVQGNLCAVCGASEPGGRGWNVDHDHACCSGKRSCGWCVRGILCHSCNTVEVAGVERAIVAGRVTFDAHRYFLDNWIHRRQNWLDKNGFLHAS
jgi:Recombination endonuclease VII